MRECLAHSSHSRWKHARTAARQYVAVTLAELFYGDLGAPLSDPRYVLDALINYRTNRF